MPGRLSGHMVGHVDTPVPADSVRGATRQITQLLYKPREAVLLLKNITRFLSSIFKRMLLMLKDYNLFKDKETKNKP